MSLEHHPARDNPSADVLDDGLARGPPNDPNFWESLINEKRAGDFLGLSDRAMQKMRQTGGGPRYVHISSRCLRYGPKLSALNWKEFSIVLELMVAAPARGRPGAFWIPVAGERLIAT